MLGVVTIIRLHVAKLIFEEVLAVTRTASSLLLRLESARLQLRLSLNLSLTAIVAVVGIVIIHGTIVDHSNLLYLQMLRGQNLVLVVRALIL